MLSGSRAASVAPHPPLELDRSLAHTEPVSVALDVEHFAIVLVAEGEQFSIGSLIGAHRLPGNELAQHPRRKSRVDKRLHVRIVRAKAPEQRGGAVAALNALLVPVTGFGTCVGSRYRKLEFLNDLRDRDLAGYRVGREGERGKCHQEGENQDNDPAPTSRAADEARGLLR
jgi:hypothetical protein